MKKLSKRFLSLMLAMIMAMPVVLAMPSTASADAPVEYDSHLRAQYLTNSSNVLADASGRGYNLETRRGSGSGNTGDFTWENGAYKFAGGSNKPFLRTSLSGILSNVDFEEGFTIVFSGKRANTDWERYFEISTGKLENGIATGKMFETGGPANTIFFSGKVENGSNGHSKVKYDGVESGNINLGDDGNWHTWAIRIKKGNETVYRDGVYVGELNDNSRLCDAWFTSIKTGWLCLGASSWTDPAFQGRMKDFRIYDIGFSDDEMQAASVDNIFHYTFDYGTDYKEEKTDSAFSIGQQFQGQTNQQFADHVWMKDAWMYANVPTAMSQTRNNKHWRMDLTFSMTNSGLGANRLEHVLGITDESNVSDSYNGGKSFGMSTDGRVYLNTTHFSQPIGDTGVNLKDYFFGAGNENNKKPMKLSYLYDHGIISVLINDEERFSYDVGDTKSTFENIKAVHIGGRNSAGNYMDLFDLAAYHIGDADTYPDNHLVAHYFADNDKGDLTTDFSGHNNTLEKIGRGATWQNCGGKMAAQFTGATAPTKDYFRIKANDILRNVNFNEGFTVTFKAKPQTHASSGWVRYLDFSAHADGIAPDNGTAERTKYFFITPSNNGTALAGV
ncbi:MAG: hypothetical protein IKR97_05175, partial [Eubacterium sp.]|nr:hypothetical protein [Eubacterium sp.]